MDFDLLPIDETMQVLKSESDPQTAFKKILAFAHKNMPSQIWSAFGNMNLERDMEEASQWMQAQLHAYPDSKGIYLGLDTLNMEEGEGTNVEIGLSKSCDPQELSDDWAYECEEYGDSHLIRGLHEVSAAFNDEDKWTSDERSFAEYVVFLGYSGVVLREALTKLDILNDFLSMWGFHDGDLFFLTQNTDGKRTVLTEKNL